jgi:hypothetical protein
MEPMSSCEHEWALILAEETWSGPRRISVCTVCRAVLREYLPSSAKPVRPLASTKVVGDHARDPVAGVPPHSR